MDTKHLVQASQMLFQDGEDWCEKGIFVSLECLMPAPNVSQLGSLDRIILAMRSITRNQWNMLTAIERLGWMRQEADVNEHIKSRWPYYAGADIEFWHVNFRSLLDHAAFIISQLAVKKGQVPDDSFHKLYDKSKPEKLLSLEGKRFAQKIGADWLSLLQTVTWFPDIVNVRDQIVHQGGHTMIFGNPEEGILFQVYGHMYQHLVRNAPLMFNKNVVRFERYAAHLSSHLLVFLEEFASIVKNRLRQTLIFSDTARNCSPGWGTLKAWVGEALTAAA